MFEIRFSGGVETDLRAIRAHYRNEVLDAIEEQLAHEPSVETKNREILVNLVPPFEAVPPIRQLRAGEYRVFYDVDEKEQIVCVRACAASRPTKPRRRSVKAINVRALQKKIKQTVDTAQKERVVLTRHGDPVAVVVGVEGMDWEDVLLQTSSSFWEMIEKRRTEETVSLKKMRGRLKRSQQKKGS